MYDVRDVGSFAIMLAVLPLFVVVFVTALIVLAPILVPMWAWGRWHSLT